MKITEIGIDDSQTGYYWLQIFVKNQKEAYSLRRQIFEDQEIKERLENAIKHNKEVVAHSTIPTEIVIHNIIIEKLQAVLEGNELSKDGPIK